MSTKIISVDKFTGLNLSPNGSTGLKLGEAAKAENVYITDDYKIKTRPGVSILNYAQAGSSIKAVWNGLLGECRWTLLIFQDGDASTLTLRVIPRNTAAEESLNQPFVDRSLNTSSSHPVKIFPHGDSIWIVGTDIREYVLLSIYRVTPDDGYQLTNTDTLYKPLVITGASPDGGGETLEPINLLTPFCKMQYSSDGTSCKYKLPPSVYGVLLVKVDGKYVYGMHDPEESCYIFDSPPAKGVNNVEFECQLNDENHTAGLKKFLAMRHSEAYNGGTDSRIFFYGDGTNVCYYTSAPTYGDGLYLPSMNEIAVDSSASAITGMRRHYTRLMVYKADGTFSINYEPVTLADGRVTAGFYVRPASRDVGNDMDNQIQTVNNYPRTLCGGSLYEWRHTASYYQDERYAKRIGQQVAPLLRAADPAKIVTCDDDFTRTYYMFLNDEEGTVLVNRYELDAWTVYTGQAFKGIRYADGFHGDLLFANDNTLFYFDPDSAFDQNPSDGDGPPLPIHSRWESGYMAFGADYLRKYSATIWVSMLPEPSSKMTVTVKTDRRDEYMTKTVGRPIFDFGSVDFSNFSFLLSHAPKIQRTKLKVKKFVYYKLIFETTEPGSKATILGYDQQIRYASYVK